MTAEAIADTTNRFNQIVIGKLFSEAFDVGVHRAICDAAAIGPSIVENLAAGKDTSRMLGEDVEKLKFGAREVDGISIVGCAELFAIKKKPGGSLRRLAACHCFDAREKFARAKGFCEIVVSTEFESDNAINLISAGCQKENGDLGRTPDFTTDFEAIEIGEADVKNNEIVSRRARHGLRARRDDADTMSRLAEGEFQNIRNSRIVLDNENLEMRDAANHWTLFVEVG